MATNAIYCLSHQSQLWNYHQSEDLPTEGNPSLVAESIIKFHAIHYTIHWTQFNAIWTYRLVLNGHFVIRLKLCQEKNKTWQKYNVNISLLPDCSLKMQICIRELCHQSSICSDNGLSPAWRSMKFQIQSKYNKFYARKFDLKTLSAKCCPFCHDFKWVSD